MSKLKNAVGLLFYLFVSVQFLLANKNTSKNIVNQHYKKVEITLTSDEISKQIAKLGIDLHCGAHLSHNHNGVEKITIEVSDYEYDQLLKYGLNPTVIINDLSKFYAKRSIEELPEAWKKLAKMKSDAISAKKLAQDMGCAEGSYPVPQNFKLGSMGGFTTYQEMLNELDQMRSLYPNLISSKIPASTTETTIEGRTVYYVRLSDNPDVDESEPEVFYNGVHHAREPLSMMNQLYYMWYLLENYDSDLSIKNIVDNVEMYFIPVINPDGYVYNEITNPNGGGMWRKNRRNNGNGTIGVDLNRNYSYQWGYNNSGSSGNPSSDTYRGPSPFSEPETRIIREFTYDREFINVFNNHSFSNLLLHPWGHISTDCPDEELFDEISEQMCWHNRYHYGNSTVIYPANGDSDDWHYGEQTTKRKILAWTPELGSSAEGGFWPSPANIVPQCERQMHMSLVLAQSAANFGMFNDLTPYGIDNQNTTLTFSIEHMSLVPGSFTVSVSSSDPKVMSIANPVMLTNILTDANYETVSTGVTLASGITAGTPISFDVVVNNGAYDIHTTTITKIYQPVEIISDVGVNLSSWTSSGGWAVTNITGYNSGSSITDSPSGNMTTTLRTLTLNAPINLSNSQNPVLEYYTKWDIFRLFDYVQIQASTNGNNWVELCGEYTKLGTNPDNVFSGNGSPDQPIGNGLYDGYQKEWVREQIDLSSYAGVNTLYLRFIAKGDNEVAKKDGIYIDDFTVYREPLGHCENAVQDADETGIDCGGADCVACPTCFDGIQNGNETGNDCGGNCGVCPVCPTSVSNFPYTESFESGLGQWSQKGGDDLNWARNSGSTPSNNTGPSSANNGNWYMYIEASNPNYPAKVAGLTSPCFNLTGMATTSLTFKYHMFGSSSDMNLTILASTDEGNSWTSPIWSQTGNKGNQWNSAIINLDEFNNQYVMLLFLGTTGETWQGDIAMDDITINASLPACAIGAACNDNDACTTGETFDVNCNCNGGTLIDSDGDGVCDTNDQCPNTDDSIVGTACNDNNACTTGDVYNSNCSCNGFFADSDGDGVCDANDICTAGDDNADADNDNIPDACDTCPNDANNTCGIPTYCTLSGNNVNYEYISNVTVGPINNTSGANGGYGDYTNISGNIVLGNTIPISLTATYPGATYPENWKIWIDFNRDGDFADLGEEVFSDTGIGTVTGNITIPNSASLGATGMRVSMVWNATPQTCGSFNYGEVEDYTVVISAVAGRFTATSTVDEQSLKTTTASLLKIHPNPVKDFINVDLLSIFRIIDSNKEANVKIFSKDGKLVMDKIIVTDTTLKVGVQGLQPKQYYLISVEIEGLKLLSNKFLKL